MPIQQRRRGRESGSPSEGRFSKVHKIELTVQPFETHWWGLITWIDMMRILTSLLVKPRILGSSLSAIVTYLLS